MQAHLQGKPFACEGDTAQNRADRESILAGLEMRAADAPEDVVMLTGEQTRLRPEEMVRVHALLDVLGLSARRRRTHMNDFSWEANQVPRQCRRVLDVGCGNGLELMFLRAVLPKAEMTALDYGDSIPEATKRAIGVKFMAGDINHLLDGLPGGYDLIYSNHTLEHLYTPDEMLRRLHGLLAEGGMLISTLPMDAMPGSPFLSKVLRAVEEKRVHALDVVFLDAGHPWKTNPPDLRKTLANAGFRAVTIYQRAEHLSRPTAGRRGVYEAKKRVGQLLHLLLCAPARAMGKLLPERAHRVYGRLLLSVERRVWFGANNLKNRFSEEALFIAVK